MSAAGVLRKFAPREAYTETCSALTFSATCQSLVLDDVASDEKKGGSNVSAVDQAALPKFGPPWSSRSDGRLVSLTRTTMRLFTEVSSKWMEPWLCPTLQSAQVCFPWCSHAAVMNELEVTLSVTCSKSVSWRRQRHACDVWRRVQSERGRMHAYAASRKTSTARSTICLRNLRPLSETQGRDSVGSYAFCFECQEFCVHVLLHNYATRCPFTEEEHMELFWCEHCCCFGSQGVVMEREVELRLGSHLT